MGEESCTRNREAKTLELERMRGFYAEQVPVSAYMGTSKNLKDLKDLA